jgi:hypothetical protein
MNPLKANIIVVGHSIKIDTNTSRKCAHKSEEFILYLLVFFHLKYNNINTDFDDNNPYLIH